MSNSKHVPITLQHNVIKRLCEHVCKHIFRWLMKNRDLVKCHTFLHKMLLNMDMIGPQLMLRGLSKLRSSPMKVHQMYFRCSQCIWCPIFQIPKCQGIPHQDGGLRDLKGKGKDFIRVNVRAVYKFRYLLIKICT